MQLRLLSGGAAHGLVDALAPRFKTETGCGIEATFGAVGAMRDKLLSGTPADILILTRRLIDELTAQNRVVRGSAVDIGTVLTAVAVRSGDSMPDIGDAARLRTALLATDAIYYPDPKLATAGIHFATVLERLGIATEVADRLEPFPNGATAMRQLAAAETDRPIGCTQVTEILSTPGVALVAPLPAGFGLATVYSAGVCADAALPDEARALAALLAAGHTRDARERAGFV
jgi:molybdate transport system substrate-binding protein